MAKTQRTLKQWYRRFIVGGSKPNRVIERSSRPCMRGAGFARFRQVGLEFVLIGGWHKLSVAMEDSEVKDFCILPSRLSLCSLVFVSIRTTWEKTASEAQYERRNHSFRAVGKSAARHGSSDVTSRLPTEKTYRHWAWRLVRFSAPVKGENALSHRPGSEMPRSFL